MSTAGPTLYYVIGAIILIAIVIIAIVVVRRAQSERLRRRFGPEYDRVASTRGDRAEAERELARREERVKKFRLEQLPAGARERYAEEWRAVQARFVDHPKEALAQADTLVTDVMRDRGYPMADFEQRAADLSPDHAGVVADYRTAHEISLRSERGTAETEELRQAMLHYRALFEDLVENKERARS
jgi:FtsZ-interacting cell division protein ZipA